MLAALAQAETRYVEGDAIVTFKATATLDQAKTVLKKKSMTFARHFGALSARRKKPIGLVRDNARTTAQIIADLRNDPDVESVEPNYLRWIKAVPNDTRFAEMWALQNTGQTVNGSPGTAGADIRFLEARNRARPGAGTPVVAVVDTGVDYTHPDIAANIWTNPGESTGNNTDDDGNGYVDDVHGYDFTVSGTTTATDPMDSGDHGTHVAGTIAATGNNNAGVIGVNDAAKIMILKVSTDGSTMNSSAIIEAFQYLVDMKNRGVNIVAINASYGGGGSSTAERDAIQAAADVGILMIVAAGNESANNNVTPSYPASYRLANEIVVAATDQNDALAGFSNYGPTTVDIAAPGANILSIKPGDVSLQAGLGKYSTNHITYTGRIVSSQQISGQLIDCGIGDVGQFPAAVSGNIALIQRGTLFFQQKVENAMAAGAVAAVIYNNVSGPFFGTMQTPGSYIPAVSISQADGLAIKAALPMQATLSSAPGYQFLDGTSMATPHVAGAVAFAAMLYPGETMAQRRQRILKAIDVLPALQTKVLTGGRLNLLHVIDGGVDGAQPWPYIVSSGTLAAGAVGESYTSAIQANGGTAPYSFVLSSGSLPDGLVLAGDGTISGTPAIAGASTFTVMVSDGNGPGASTDLTINIAAEPLKILTSGTLPDGQLGTDYSQTFAASGGTLPYTWSVTGAPLPQGLAFTSSGELHGLPSLAGSGSFTITVQDAHGRTTSLACQLTIDASLVSITTPSSLPGAVKNVTYQQSLVAIDGTPPYLWTLVGGSLPQGIVLASSGVLSGKPLMPVNTSFTAKVVDAVGNASARLFTLAVTPAYVIPVVNPVTLGPTTIGMSFGAKVTATNYPKAFSILGLPRGVTYSSVTGVISGRPSVSGSFNVTIKSTNSAGTSAPVVVPFVVNALPAGAIGSFTGLVDRNAGANGGLGSRLDLTTTALGAFTARVTTGAAVKSATGYLLDTAPQLRASIGGHVLNLTFDAGANLVGGTYDAAVVTGWRQTWNAITHPATQRVGYYSAGITLADAGNIGVEGIPQGDGYVTFTMTGSGTFTLAGRTADGQSISSSGFVGPIGEMLMYRPLYSNRGSLTGTMRLDVDPGLQYTENIVSGSLTWLKPKNTSRAYAAGFGPLNLSAYGKYLSVSASGHVVLGLPAAGTAALKFFDGGLSLAAIDPDIASFGYSSTYVVTMPKAGTADNPAKATLSINRASGAASGTFTLQEASPKLTRTVTWYGMIVRPASGTAKATGAFLLPQIPLSGQTISNSPILSGKVVIDQP